MKASPEPKGALPWKGAGMTPNELGLWVGQLGENAMEVLATRDGGPPTALVVVQGVPIATEMVLAGEEDKALRRAYFEMAARGGAEACALVAEGWSARISATARPLAARPGLTSLAEVAGRREVLIIHAVSPQGEATRVFRIVRRRDRVALVVDPQLSAADDMVSPFLTGLPWALAGRPRRCQPKARSAGSRTR
jgi:hypothetical protein